MTLYKTVLLRRLNHGQAWRAYVYVTSRGLTLLEDK